MKQFPYWKRWYIERNGTEMLATHQVAYLFARKSGRYPDYVAEILNLNGRDEGDFRDDLDRDAFDRIFDKLFAEVDEILRDLMDRHRPDVVSCHLNNSTWPGTLYLLRRGSAPGFGTAPMPPERPSSRGARNRRACSL